ncbi:MAG: hypothetical protein ACJAYU_004677 [Bradymonadia bacterium]
MLPEDESNWASLTLLGVVAVAPSLLVLLVPNVSRVLDSLLGAETTTTAIAAVAIAAELLAITVYWGTSPARWVVKVFMAGTACLIGSTLALMIWSG